MVPAALVAPGRHVVHLAQPQAGKQMQSAWPACCALSSLPPAPKYANPKRSRPSSPISHLPASQVSKPPRRWGCERALVQVHVALVLCPFRLPAFPRALGRPRSRDRRVRRLPGLLPPRSVPLTNCRHACYPPTTPSPPRHLSAGTATPLSTPTPHLQDGALPSVLRCGPGHR